MMRLDVWRIVACKRKGRLMDGTETWRQQRERLTLRVKELRRQGICDLHLQLLPRYAGEPIGSTRFVAERRPITDGDETTELIRSALQKANGGNST
jgi:diadenosine tetraphosphate (Ap4A) HIT family hydrolase